MEIRCYGWCVNSSGRLETNLPIQSQRVKLFTEGLVDCGACTEPCIFETGDVRVSCPGLRSDGDWRFVLTVREAERINGKISCSLTEGEKPCSVCLLTLRKQFGAASLASIRERMRVEAGQSVEH